MDPYALPLRPSSNKPPVLPKPPLVLGRTLPSVLPPARPARPALPLVLLALALAPVLMRLPLALTAPAGRALLLALPPPLRPDRPTRSEPTVDVLGRGPSEPVDGRGPKCK